MNIVPVAKAQFGGIVSEPGEFLLCLQQNKTRRQCLKESPQPDLSVTSSKPQIDDGRVINPFYPSTANNPAACRNRSFHLDRNASHLDDDPSELISISRVESRNVSVPELISDSDAKTSGIVNPEGSELPENDDAYVALFFEKRMAITSISIAWQSPHGTVPLSEAGGYIVQTGFGRLVNTNPPCHIGELIGIPFDGKTHTYQIADATTQAPMKADYILIKRLPGAKPASVSIIDMTLLGVPADSGEPEQTTSVTGKVSLAGIAGIPVSNASIYDISLGEDAKKLLAVTNEAGGYSITTIPQDTRLPLLIEREYFQSKKQTITINRGVNERNFTLALASENRVSGRITNESGVSQEGVYIIARQGSAVIDVAQTDASGNYTLTIDSDGTYDIEPLENDSLDKPVSAAPKSAAGFKKTSGERLLRNFQVKSNRLNGFTLGVVAESVSIDSKLMRGEVLRGARLALYRGNTPTGQPIAVGSAPTNFGTLPFGTYTVLASTQNYKSKSVTFTRKSAGSHIISIKLETNLANCVRQPQATVKEFWLCGNEAKVMLSNDQYRPTILAIDGKIGELRQKFGYNDLPQQVVIYSSTTSNAFFTGSTYYNSGRCPLPLGSNPLSGRNEMILLTTALLGEYSPEQISHTVTHEWGHGKDFRDNGCHPQIWRSEKKDFVEARRSGFIMLRDTIARSSSNNSKDGLNLFYSLIKDSTYDPDKPEAGHPQDNAGETFASYIHARHDHMEQSDQLLVKPAEAKHSVHPYRFFEQIVMKRKGG